MTPARREGEPVAGKVKGHWAAEQRSPHPAAIDYLNLLMSPELAQAVSQALEAAPLEHHRANDLLRASGLALLPVNDPQVAKDIKAARRGKKLAPVLLIRGRAAAGRALIIADGYHRICASCHIDTETQIPCRVVELPDGAT